MTFIINHLFVYTERKGKFLHLLKAGSKAASPIKKRRKVQLLGTFDEFKASKQKPGQPPGNSGNAGGNSGNSIAQFLKPQGAAQQAQRDAQMSIDAILCQPGDQQPVAKEEKGKKK